MVHYPHFSYRAPYVRGDFFHALRRVYYLDADTRLPVFVKQAPVPPPYFFLKTGIFKYFQRGTVRNPAFRNKRVYIEKKQ